MKTNINISTNVKAIEFLFEFSICTLVTRREEYEEMLQSFLEKGFEPSFCEYLYIDNTVNNSIDAFEGTNIFLSQAKGKYIIICHQDILINKDNIDKLRLCISQLDEKNPKWAICGNAGAAGPNYIVYHISYPNNLFMDKGRFPLRVSSVDENFMLVKNNAFLKVSNNLKGFHLYGTDLCLQADLNGFSSYVIAFNLTHKSRGNKDKSFSDLEKALIKKYNKFFNGRWIQTNSTIFYLSGSSVNRLLFGNAISLFFVRMFNGIRKRV